ncbi:MAG: hypothetical protein ACRDTR_18510 [Rubrobacter sp.]
MFRWPRTWKGWGLFALGLVTFLILDVLALMGEDLATKLLVSLSGTVLGAVVAYAVTRPFRRFVGVGVWRTLGIFLGLALTFVIVFAGSALAGIPAFPTAQSGNVGAVIYGFAFGFGISVPGGLGASGPFGARGPRGTGNPELRTVVLVLGVVAGLFALLFALFVLVEYLVAPLIQQFAG